MFPPRSPLGGGAAPEGEVGAAEQHAGAGGEAGAAEDAAIDDVPALAHAGAQLVDSGPSMPVSLANAAGEEMGCPAVAETAAEAAPISTAPSALPPSGVAAPSTSPTSPASPASSTSADSGSAGDGPPACSPPPASPRLSVRQLLEAREKERAAAAEKAEASSDAHSPLVGAQ